MIRGLHKYERLEKAANAEERSHDYDAERVAALPFVRDTSDTPDLTMELRRPGGTWTLRKEQSACLYWLREARGLLADIAVGGGKTIIAALAASVLPGIQRPVILVPPRLQGQMHRMISEISRHFRVHPNLRVVPYSILSAPSGANLLAHLNPDLIIADEAHNLRDPSAARTRRFIRHFKSHPDTVFAAMSGTITSKSIIDYAHLIELAFRSRSPLPLKSRELIAWAHLVDADAIPQPGDGTMFEPIVLPEERMVWRSVKGDEFQEHCRYWYRRRLKHTAGVVSTKGSSTTVALEFERICGIPVPEDVQKTLDEVEGTWTRPDGEELQDALSKYRVARDLAHGFYYRWVWPNGVPDDPWLAARKGWHRAIREVLESDTPGMDSPFLVTQAVVQGKVKSEYVNCAWESWDKQRHKPTPPTETVWISDYIVEYAKKWLRNGGIVWYEDTAIANRLRQHGILVYGAGDDPPNDGRPCAASVQAQATGFNLQSWSRNLILAAPRGQKMEQLVGRTHRPGQCSDLVEVEILAHVPALNKAIDLAVSDARYVEQTTGQAQKILYGTWR